MDNNYRQALTEVLEVLNHTEKELVKRVPQDFAIFLFNNQDKDYKPTIDFTSDNWEIELKSETQAILAFIYKEYMLGEQEKSSLISDEELVKTGEEMLKKFGVEDLFAPSKKKLETHIIENAPIDVKKISWYKRLVNKILTIFK